MKITKTQLRRIIRESLLSEILPDGTVPRSVQADYDIANKEETFPAPKETLEFIPRSADTKQAARMIRSEFNKILSKMSGFEAFMQGQGSAVNMPLNKVLDALKPAISKMGLTVEHGQGEAFIYYDPAGVEISLFADYTGTTEIDFGDL